ncbi:MAG: hypothetical protein M3M96_00220, partial [Candidatus Eremiobacteraeota bacterium]|nr:hypothetical protein [Candidatus Eremiobacteraeota bacterium]
IWPTLLRFSGQHPPAACATIEMLAEQRRSQFELTDAIVAESQSLGDRVRNRLMKLNYEQRWRSRALRPLARRLLSI